MELLWNIIAAHLQLRAYRIVTVNAQNITMDQTSHEWVFESCPLLQQKTSIFFLPSIEMLKFYPIVCRIDCLFV